MGTLFVVPTPIGNLEDITLRALRVLKEAALIAAEDTRTSRVLLRHYEIETALTSYHEHNKLTKLDAIFDTLAVGDVALISDAGMPGISDPGYELIREAIERGYRVEPLPGANAIIPALVGSGLPTDSFTYIGFLPKKSAALRALLAELTAEPRPIVAYESPNRLTKALEAIMDVLGPRNICVAREVSKKFEEFQRGAADEILAHYTDHPPRGEITLVIGPAAADDNVTWDKARVRAALADHVAAGESLSGAAKAVAAESGWKKRDVYALGTDT